MTETLREQESLRDQQKRLARTRIVDAAAAEIVESGLEGLSVPAVAERAGVSLRTVYNYFETKDALIDGIRTEANQRMEELGMIEVEPDMEKVPDAIQTNWRAFAQLGVLSRALGAIGLQRATEAGLARIPAGNAGMTEALRTGIAELRPELEAGQVDALLAVIRLIVSFDGWHRLTHEFNIDAELSGTVTAWAFTTLREALARGEGPWG